MIAPIAPPKMAPSIAAPMVTPRHDLCRRRGGASVATAGVATAGETARDLSDEGLAAPPTPVAPAMGPVEEDSAMALTMMRLCRLERALRSRRVMSLQR